MITKPMDVLEQYPVRKSKKQKAAFRDDVQVYLEKLGYQVIIQKGDFGSQNIIAGDPKTAKFLVTAHYDTPAGMPVPNLITPCHVMPFVLYQLFMTILLFIIPCLGELLVSKLFPDFILAGSVWYWLFFIEAAFMMVGPANPNNANDNTSGVVSVLDIALNLPMSERNKVCFVLFDLEEAGLIGSASYAAKYSAVAKQQIVLNLDCVGDGDYIYLFPTAKMRKDGILMTWLNQAECINGEKSVSVRNCGFSYYPSDQANFKFGVGISALNKAKNGWLYCGKVHTKYDTNLDESNVKILRNCLVDIIRHDAAVPEVVAVKEKPKLHGWKKWLLLLLSTILLGFALGVILEIYTP